MNLDPKINLVTFLSSKNESELKEYAEIALKSGNKILFQAIEKIQPNFLKKKSSFFENDLLFFEICKYGTPFSFHTFIKNRASNLIYDQENNSCLHISAKFGNIHVFFFF